MLVLERATAQDRTRARVWLRATLRSLPGLSLWGIGLLALGFAVDVVAHLDDPGSVAAEAGHLAVGAGMILTLAGVLVRAVRWRSAPRRLDHLERRES